MNNHIQQGLIILPKSDINNVNFLFIKESWKKKNVYHGFFKKYEAA